MHKGQIIAGRFELEAKVASGGMGSIFRARDLTSGSPVAVKTWPAGFSADHESRASRRAERSLQRFEREAAALAAVTHPAVVRYIAHGAIDSGEPFLVMHWVEGCDLSEKLRASGLSVSETLELAERMLAALAALHTHGVVHRDLKPANVMLEGAQARRAVLVDFGIARGSQMVTVTGHGAQLGTPCYMSPEQIRDPRTVDGRADVFALGCIVFECLSGARAFQGDDVLETLAQVLLEGAPDLSRLRPDLPEPIVHWVMDLLASDREQRPFADQALVQRVSQLLAACPTQRLGPPGASLGASVSRQASGMHETLDARLETATPAADSASVPSAGGAASLDFDQLSGPLIAREAELSQSLAAVARGAPVVLLWGPPGIGKTRLALELLRRAMPATADFESRLRIDLSSARDPPAALGRFARTIGASTLGLESVTTAIGHVLSTAGPALALLDGVDGLLPELSASIAAWRRLAPQLTLIVTSRARVLVPGALTLELPPLSTLGEHELDPSLAPSPWSPSAQLFLAHADLAGSSLALREPAIAVERIVRELQGIPLAIELAAARVPSLGIGGVLSLCTRPLGLSLPGEPRVAANTLHAALRSAWDSLSFAERAVLGACAVFSGGFSAEGAAEVAPSLHEGEVSRMLHALREKSLLRASPAGFSLFSVVREFALGELARGHELQPARLRHAAYASRRASALKRLPGERALELTRRIEAESDDLIAAVESALDPKACDLELALGILCALEPVIVARGPQLAFLELIDRAVAASEPLSSRAPFAPLSRLLLLRARLRATSARFTEANADLQASERLAPSDSELAGAISLEHGVIHHFQRELPAARRCYERAIAQLRPSGDGLLLGRCYGNLGAVFHDNGKLIEAAAYYWKAIQSLEEAGDVRVLANFLGNLALLEQELGSLPSARRRYQKAVSSLHDVGDGRLRAITIGNLGCLEAELGDWQAARRCHELALGLLRPLDDPRSLALCQARLGAALAMLGLLAPATEALSQARSLALGDDRLLLETVKIQHAFLALGSARAAELAGDRETASSQLGRAEADCRHARRAHSDGRSLAQLSDDIRTALRTLTPLILELRAALGETKPER